MDGQPVHGNASRTPPRSVILLFPPISKTQDPLAGAAAGGDAAVHRGAVERGEERILRGKWIGKGGIGVRTQAAADQESLDSAGDATGDPFHLGGFGRRKRAEFRLEPGIPLENSVQGQGVEVDIQVQRVAESLDEGHGAALRRRNPPSQTSAAPERSEKCPDENAQDRLRKARVEGKSVAQVKGKGEDPLADGHAGKD
jgi:hypothetical protein